MDSRISGWLTEDSFRSGTTGRSQAVLGTKVGHSTFHVYLAKTRRLTLQQKGFFYTGPISPNTSLFGWINEYGFTDLYFQATNNSIMQLSIRSETASTTFSLVEVGVGSPGTRIGGVGNYPQITTISIFF